LQQHISETKIQRGTKLAPENKVAAVHQLVSNGAQLLNTELTDQISVFSVRGQDVRLYTFYNIIT
jgi:hypothetical protein